jgi:prepilin-type N-terminal cleavage/methylation domain-containing protein
MRNRQKGFSLIELLIVVAIILIIAAIAIPNLLRSRMAANEASAVGSLRTINTACVTYSSTYGVGFPSNLSNLGTSGTASSTSADLIDNVLAGGAKSGYTFTYAAGTAAAGVVPTYTLHGDPITPGQTGQRYFFTDQSGVIRFNPSAAATNTDTPIS